MNKRIKQQRAFEREVLALFKLVYPDTRRGGRYATKHECTIEGTPFRVECERQEATINEIYKPVDPVIVLESIDEEGLQQKDPRLPIAVVKNTREPAIACMYLRDFLKMVEDHFHE